MKNYLLDTPRMSAIRAILKEILRPLISEIKFIITKPTTEPMA